MKKQMSTSIKFLPIIIFISYLLFTVVLYAFGPFAWNTQMALLFYALQFIYIFALYIGYYFGIHKKERNLKNVKTPANKKTKEKNKKFIKTVSVLLVINLFITVISIFRGYGYKSLNFTSLFQELFWGITHAGEGYNSIYDRRFLTGGDVVGGSFFTFIILVWDFIGLVVLLIGIFDFKKFKVGTKIVIVISCLLTILYYFSIGTNIGIFRIVLAVLLAFVVNRICKRNQKHNKMRKIVIFAVWIIGVIGFIVYFVYTMKSRGGILNWDKPYYNIGGIKLDRDSIFFKILPESLYLPFISLSGYLSQGYYGFSLSLSQPWIPTFGFGHNMFFVDLFSEYGIDINSLTYQYRVEQVYGWDSRVHWASMYSWFANDLSFVGVILVMYFFGYILALAYRDAINQNNIFAKILLFFLALQVIFIPCNNQVFQSTYTCFSFITTFILWIRSRKRTNALIRQTARNKKLSVQLTESNGQYK